MPAVDDEALQIRQALRRIHLFSDVLRHDQLDDLARDCSPRFFRAGSVLMRQGDFGTAMFCIDQGVVSVTYTDAANRDNQIRQLGSGNVVGEIEILTGERRVATITAVTDVRALRISKAALEGMFERSPDLFESFGATLATRMTMLHQIVPERGASLKQRLVQLIRNSFSKISRHAEERREPG